MNNDLKTPNALPGLWREERGLSGLVRLDVPASTPGMVVVAKADWDSVIHSRRLVEGYRSGFLRVFLLFMGLRFALESKS